MPPNRNIPKPEVGEIIPVSYPDVSVFSFDIRHPFFKSFLTISRILSFDPRNFPMLVMLFEVCDLNEASRYVLMTTIRYTSVTYSSSIFNTRPIFVSRLLKYVVLSIIRISVSIDFSPKTKLDGYSFSNVISGVSVATVIA